MVDKPHAGTTQYIGYCMRPGVVHLAAIFSIMGGVLMAKRIDRRQRWNEDVYRLKEYGIPIKKTGKNSWSVDLRKNLSKLFELDLRDPAVKRGLNALRNKQLESMGAARRRLQKVLEKESLSERETKEIKGRIRDIRQTEEMLKANRRSGKQMVLDLQDALQERVKPVGISSIRREAINRAYNIFASGVFTDKIDMKTFNQIRELAARFGFNVVDDLFSAMDALRRAKYNRPSDQVVEDYFRELSGQVRDFIREGKIPEADKESGEALIKLIDDLLSAPFFE